MTRIEADDDGSVGFPVIFLSNLLVLNHTIMDPNPNSKGSSKAVEPFFSAGYFRGSSKSKAKFHLI